MQNTVSEVDGLTVTRLGNALGAEVSGLDFSQPLSPATVEFVGRAWAEHLVLRFRGVHDLGPDALIAFSRHFGALDKRPIATGARSAYFEVDRPELTIISNVLVDGKPIGGLGAYEADWHADMTYTDRPPKGSCLYSVEIPPRGGNTHFANMYMAYDMLDEKLKAQVEGLTCVHDASRSSAGELRHGFEDTSDPRKTVGPVHPLVRVHPATGRRCLLLGRRRNAYIPGYALEESESLLDRLWSHATRAEFVWAQEWRLGDMIMWDNRCTMHRRDAFDSESRRIMLRTQISGEPVVGP